VAGTPCVEACPKAEGHVKLEVVKSEGYTNASGAILKMVKDEPYAVENRLEKPARQELSFATPPKEQHDQEERYLRRSLRARKELGECNEQKRRRTEIKAEPHTHLEMMHQSECNERATLPTPKFERVCRFACLRFFLF